MKNIAGILVALMLLPLIAYGCWKAERWFHYKFGYQSQVQAEMQPLAKRISDLELRVSVMETNKQR